jgi:hypothetical protein
MQAAELQQVLQRQVGQFCERVSQALEPLEASPSRAVSDAALREALLYASSAIDIATGPVPALNLIDMLVFLRLCRKAVESYWIPAVYGEDGAGVAAAFSKSEEDLWRAITPVATENQRRDLEGLVDEWIADNPGQFRVEGVRLDDFVRQTGATAQARADRARGLLAGVKAATQAADQALMLAERGIFLVNRLPFLWRLQARVASREIVSDLAAQLRAIPEAIGRRALCAPTALLRRLTAGRAG